MNEPTRLLQAIENRDELAAERLLPLIYDQLHGLAADAVAPECVELEVGGSWHGVVS